MKKLNVGRTQKMVSSYERLMWGRFLPALFIAALLLINSGCTRKVGEDAGVKISFNTSLNSQKVGSLNTTQQASLAVIRINVRGSNFPLRTFEWDCGDDEDGCTKQPPATVEMTIPSGANATVQLLQVYKTEDDKNIFSYGDAEIAVVPGDNIVNLTTQIYDTIDNKEVTIAGQYVEQYDSTLQMGKGPTGMLDVVYQPPKPGALPMVVEQSEIFNGWFSVFGILGVPMQYVLRSTGQPLRQAGVPLTADLAKSLTTGTNAANSQVSMFEVPEEFYINEGSSGLRKQSGAAPIFGFFGISNQLTAMQPKACYPEYPGSISQFYADENGSTPLSYCHGSTCASESIRRLGGGVSAEVESACYTNTSKSLSFRPEMMRNGRSESMGIKGPFAAAYYHTMHGCGYGYSVNTGCYKEPYSTFPAQLKLHWAYVPGVIESGALTGVTLFTKKYQGGGCDWGMPCNADFRKPMSDLFLCSSLEKNGFSAFADYTGTGPKSVTIENNTLLPLQAGEEIIAILCPYRDVADKRQYFSMGHQFYDLKGPPLPVPNVKLRTTADVTDDEFLVGNLAGMQVIHGAVNAAVRYETTLTYASGSQISGCSPISSATTTVNIPQACRDAFVGEGTEFKVGVIAFDANERLLAETQEMFVRLETAPETSAVDITCSASSGVVISFSNLDPDSEHTIEWQYGGTPYLIEDYQSSTVVFNSAMPTSGLFSVTGSLVSSKFGYSTAIRNFSFDVDNGDCTGASIPAVP